MESKGREFLAMVTNTGLAFATALFGNVSSPSAMTYITYGTGTTAEAASQQALITEPASVRVLATFTKETVLGPNDTLKWYGAITPAAGATVTEVGVFNASSSGGMLFRKLLTTPVTFTTGQTIGMIGRLTMKNGTYDFS